jgi:NAD+-dependent secondary alcohol dehydrogenase Adh1
MKAAVLHAFDEKLTAKEFVRFADVADPKISRPTDVVVRIGGAGVCRTDLHIVEGIWRSKVDIKLPYIMGHENAGWVEAVGPGVEGGEDRRQRDLPPARHQRALSGLSARR